jgi:hypothetical protein
LPTTVAYATKVPGVRRHTLAEYQRHVEAYGPECMLEAAAGELAERELGKLAVFIDHLERMSVFRHGHWQHHGQEVRVCEECGKDLPRTASRRMRRHPHCRVKASERRRKAQAA